MPVNVYATNYIVEIQNSENREGTLCANGLEVEVDNLGGGPFLKIKTRNLDPSPECDEQTITADRSEVEQLCQALTMILDEHTEKPIETT